MKNKKNAAADKRRKPSNPKGPLRPHHPSKVSKSKPSSSKNTPRKPNLNLNSHPIIPFEPTSTLLLIGEGDFSYTLSILRNSLIASASTITTTAYDSEKDVYEKYPQAESHVTEIKEAGGRVVFGVDVMKPTAQWGKVVRKREYEVIIFNFPHRGGLTSDVDRQIRANQELLLAFLTNAKQLLTPTGSVVITLFDGQPYVQWNLKELAKSAGYQSRRSFKFDAGLYEGYKHVRTIGNRDREGDWKGEDRGARSWVLEVVGAGRRRDGAGGKGGDRGKKGGKERKGTGKKKGESSDDEDDDE